MAQVEATRTSVFENKTLRRWISRAFLLSILVYLVVIGYLLAEAVTGASKWAPYGVNIPTFIALIIGSEVLITLTAAWIFKEDSGIWPSSVAEGWDKLRDGAVVDGVQKILIGAWDVSLIDLRLRTARTIFLGRLNRLAALVPLVYVLAASAGGAPWGMRSTALVDIGLTLVVWAFMELVMVRPQPAADVAIAGAAPSPLVTTTPAVRRNGAAPKVSSYEVRVVEPRDIERIEELERLKWKEQAAGRDKILSRLERFPQGQLAAVHVSSVDGVPTKRRLVAWCTAMPARESQIRRFARWDEVTSNGTISNTDPDGDVIVGVNLTSVTEGATYLLVGELFASVVEWNKTKFLGGGRLNGYAAFNERRRAEGRPQFSADSYARLREIRGYRMNEDRIDAGLAPLPDDAYVRLVSSLRAERGEPPLDQDGTVDYVCSNVRSYASIGMRMVRVIPDYFDDPASDSYGVLGQWLNPLPRPLSYLPWLRRWVATRIRREVRREWEARKQLLRDRGTRKAAERVPEFLRREPASETEAEPAGAAIESDVPGSGPLRRG